MKITVQAKLNGPWNQNEISIFISDNDECHHFSFNGF